jgi:hypothetical protein
MTVPTITPAPDEQEVQQLTARLEDLFNELDALQQKFGHSDEKMVQLVSFTYGVDLGDRYYNWIQEGKDG